MSMTVEMILRLIDQATGPIRGVENELGKLQKTAAAIDAQRGAGGGVKASVWLEQQQAIRKAREEAERYEQAMGKVNAAQSAAMSAAAARGLERVSTAMWRASVREGVAGEHSQVSLETQGNSVAQVEEIQREAAELSRRYRAFSRTQVENMLGDAQTFVGSLEHATVLMPDLLRLRSIQQGMHGHSDDKEFGYLAKALEQGGVASDPEKARRRIDTFARWMEVYRDTFHVNDINEFYKGLKGPIARSLDEDFLRGAGGHFIQEMGGHAVGNALTQMAMAIQAGRAQPRALAALNELGLLDMNKAIEGGPFGVKAAEPGAIKGGRLFGSRPDRWVWEILGPALDKLTPDKREEVESALFSDQTARNIADKLLHQRAVIEKDYGFNMRAPGLGAAETWATKDPAMAATGVRSQFDNLMRDAGKPFMPGATKVLNLLSDIESQLGKVAEEHPAASAAAGIGAIFAGWSAAAAVARRALIFGGQAWGEGLARATGEVVKEPGFVRQTFGSLSRLIGKPSDFTTEFVRAAGGIERVQELGRGAIGTLRNGLVAGALQWAGQWALEKFEEKAFGWTPELLASREAENTRKAHAWWRSNGVDLPWWEKEHVAPAPYFARQPEPPPMALQPIGPRLTVPTFAAIDSAGGSAAPAQSGSATPHIDMSDVEAATTKAQQAGEQIKQSLDVTASPTVDASSLDAFVGKLREARALLGQLDQMGSALRRAGGGAHALHDGAEAH